MRTTVNLDDELLKDAKRLSGIDGTTQVINAALKALVEREAARRLAKMGGTMPDLQPIPRRRSETQGSYASEVNEMESSAKMVQIAAEKAAVTSEEWYKPDQPSLGEYQTRYALIDPILRALGWDTADPTVCYPEWHYKNQRVDYALFPRSTAQDFLGGLLVPAIIIEAKSIYRTDQPRGEYGQAIWEEDVQQLQDYIEAEPMMQEGLAVLTNGRKWLLYLLGDGRRLRDFEPVEADLERDSAAFFAETLCRHMGRQHW